MLSENRDARFGHALLVPLSRMSSKNRDALFGMRF
jgi:hypothetical protein